MSPNFVKPKIYLNLDPTRVLVIGKINEKHLGKTNNLTKTGYLIGKNEVGKK